MLLALTIVTLGLLAEPREEGLAGAWEEKVSV